MLSDGDKVLLRFFSVPFTSNSEFDPNQGLPLYPAYMRVRIREVADAVPPAARGHFMVRFMISLGLSMGLLIVAFAVFLILAVMDDVGKELLIQRFGYGMIGIGLLSGLAFWVALEPLLVASGRSAERKFGLAPLNPGPGDEKIVARIHLHNWIMVAVVTIVFSGVGVWLLTSK